MPGSIVASAWTPRRFFDQLRACDVLGPTLTAAEVSGTGAVFEACAAARWPVTWTAYALATAYHETAHTMYPVTEQGGPDYFRRMYDITGPRPDKARLLGNLNPGDGARYCGRGYVQLTGKSNYARAERETGAALLSHPERALLPDVAAAVMVRGMAEGWFTGRRLGDALPRQAATLDAYCEARRIINGTDRAADIAGYARHFNDALIAGDWT